MPDSKPQPPKLPAFETFGEKSLIDAKAAAKEWTNAVSREDKPHWLFLTGKSGIGKSQLAKWAHARIKEYGLNIHRDRRYPRFEAMEWKFYPRFTSRLRQNGFMEATQANETPILFLDDFGAEYQTDVILAVTNELFELRQGRWTLITSNLSIEEIATAYSTRIADRLMRNGNKVVKMEAESYALRQNRG